MGLVQTDNTRVQIDTEYRANAHAHIKPATDACRRRRLDWLNYRKGLVLQHWKVIVFDERNFRVRDARRLLGSLLYQALDDGMDAVRISVLEEAGEASLKLEYRGPHALSRPIWKQWAVERGEVPDVYDSPVWFDMIAPPPLAFSPMLNVLLKTAQAPTGIPPRLLLPLSCHMARWNADLTLAQPWSFTISGLEGYFEVTGKSLHVPN